MSAALLSPPLAPTLAETSVRTSPQTSPQTISKTLEDSFGRRFTYLRLSITEACNFRCKYCLPDGYKPSAHGNHFLELHEIKNLVAGFAEIGTKKIRLTGGEPTLRADLTEIARAAKDTPGIETIGLSTNGMNMKRAARSWFDAGITNLNISMDSLIPEKFKEITGRDGLPLILEGIEEGLALGFPTIKVNAVLMAGWNESELVPFLEWIRERPITVRFIELMPTADNQRLFKSHHVKAETVRTWLTNNGWAPRKRGETDGPAVEFIHADYKGRFGLIAPYSHDFCSSCNRLRITSRGGLRLCLFGENDHSIRAFLQRAEDRPRLHEEIRMILGRKDATHYLPEGRFGNNRSFSMMGG